MRLLDAFIPVLAFVRQFALRPDASPAGTTDPALLSAQLDGLLATARQQALEHGASADAAREALFAVAAWTDETLMTCGWRDAAAWQQHLLQRRLFGVSNAGLGFYEHMDQLAPGQEQVEEVYLMCLILGFQGRYGHGGAAAERDLRLQSALQRATGGADPACGTPLAPLPMSTPLFPAGYAAPRRGARRAPRPRWMPSRLALAVAAGSVAVLCALYALSLLALSRSVETLLPQIR